MKTAFVVASCLLLATCEGSARPQATPDGAAAAGAAAPSPAVRSSFPRISEHDHTAPDTLRDRILGVSLRLVREAREPRRLWMHDMSSLEDADADAHFRFRIGDRVTTPRGEGRIRWGGASGDLVQYEIERGDGSLFGVQEKEVRRR